ncbi:unnamed protein product [Cylindrotheca closterium]|uniref:PDZ domain-containing protein n=1 Tax=Cylindrotheca closterium TaxID=2856 RepID=A0AAD2GCT8_9STRA|nr:unnamed protein product [Cylindrotheca closterium]
MKVRLQKSVRFQEPTLSNHQYKSDDWRELLKEEDSNLIDNEENDESDDREEWEPATAKVTVIQRDAPPEVMDEISVNEADVVVESYLAVAKRNPNRDVGIYFTRAKPDSPLCIEHITSHGPFSYSDLESGMIVSAINGKYMTWSSPEEAMAELEKETTMTVTAEFAPEKYYCKEYTMILEANMEDYFGTYGVTFDRKGENLPLYVKTVQEDGPFADLLPGLKVIAIDDQFMAWETPEKAQEALDSIQNGVKYITVEATTETVNTTIQQVELDMNESNEVVITEVATFSKQCPLDLREGMTVVMLNGKICSETSSIDELVNGAGTIWDIIAVDLNCRRLLVNQDRSAGEAMVSFCGAGALGMAAVSFHAIDMCTYPLNNMLSQRNVIEEKTQDEVAGTRELLLDEEETATRDAAASEDAVNEKDEFETGTETQSTIDKELASAHAESKPFDEHRNEETSPQAQGKITIVSQNAKEEDNETISQQGDTSNQAMVRSRPTVLLSRSIPDVSPVGQSTDAAKRTSSQETVKSEETIAPAAVLRSVQKSSPIADETKMGRTADSPYHFFSTNAKRNSFVFSLDMGKIEKAPTTMHSFQIQKICNEDVGLKLAQGQNGGVYIAEMESHCKFRGSGVKSGMRIAKINGVDCPNSIRVTTSYINGIEGKLNLVTTFGAKPKATKSPQIFFSSY